MRGFLVILLGVAAAAAAVTFLLQHLRRRANARDFRLDDRQAWQVRWGELEAMLDASSPEHWSVAVIEADKLFDRVMKSMAMPGKDFGERLRFLSSSRPEIRAVWPAHITRNRLVHEAHYELSRREAGEALKVFERGLKELGVL